MSIISMQTPGVDVEIGYTFQKSVRDQMISGIIADTKY
jgi:hypothetical protein